MAAASAPLFGRSGMTGHGSGIAQAEVHVVMAVNAAESATASLVNEGRERAGPLGHPVHGDAPEQRAARSVKEGGGARMRIDEPSFLARHELRQTGSVDWHPGLPDLSP